MDDEGESGQRGAVRWFSDGGRFGRCGGWMCGWGWVLLVVMERKFVVLAREGKNA